MSSKSEGFLLRVAVVVLVVGCVEDAAGRDVGVSAGALEEEELKRIEVARVVRGSIWVRCWRNGVGLARRLRARRRTSILKGHERVGLCRSNWVSSIVC